MNRPRIAGALLCAAALVVAGCSGDDDDSASGATTSTTATSSTSSETTAPSSGTGTTPTSFTQNALPPVGVGVPAELVGNLFVTVTSIEPTTITAEGPGQVTGPGVLVTVEVRNDTDQAFDLAGLAINAHYGDGTPAVPDSVQPGRLSGTVAPGERKRGTYAFSVPEDQRASVVIDLQHSAAPNVVIVDASR